MSKLVWDQQGERLYETGVDHGVLYRFGSTAGTYENGVAWNGLTAVNETPSGGEATALYADNIKYLNLMSVEELGLSIEAYTYPDEFMECDGSASVATGVYVGQQTRKHFGFCYRTLKGDDQQGTDLGYIIHIIYDCLASPSEKGYSTVNDSPDAIQFSWEVTTTPVAIGDDYKPSAMIKIDSTKFTTDQEKAKLTRIENELYGTDQAEPTLISAARIIGIIDGSVT